MSRCVHCGAPLRWATTAKNRRVMPLDRRPTPLGHVVLNQEGLAVVLNDTDRNLAVQAGRTVYRAHFASCPNYERKQP